MENLHGVFKLQLRVRVSYGSHYALINIQYICFKLMCTFQKKL